MNLSDAAATRLDICGEAALWAHHLAVLRQGLILRKPEARSRIRSEAAKLEREIEAMSARRRLAVKAARRPDCESGVAAAFAQLDAQIAARMRQVSDLAGLMRDPAAPCKTRDEGATAEAAARPAAIDPVTMLQGKGKLGDDQVRAAREIAWVHEAIARAGRARVSRLSQIDAPAGWQEIPLSERAAFIHARRFLPWAEGLRRTAPATLDIVLQVVVLGISVYSVARARRMSWNGCVARLADGLDRYWRGARGGRNHDPSHPEGGLAAGKVRCVSRSGADGFPDCREMVRVPADRR